LDVVLVDKPLVRNSRKQLHGIKQPVALGDLGAAAFEGAVGELVAFEDRALVVADTRLVHVNHRPCLVNVLLGEINPPRFGVVGDAENVLS
jgi:hypothetical protein